jgi:hypothetical protein
VLLPHYAADPPDCSPEYRAALAEMNSQADPDAAFVTLDTAANCYFNYQRTPSKRYGLAANDKDPLSARVRRILDEISSNFSEVWLIAPGDDESATERAILQDMPRTREWQFGEVRLLQARRGDAEPPATAQIVGTRIGEQVELVAMQAEDEITPGDEMHVDLYWQALADMSFDYSVSLQLLGPDGRLVAQDDRPAGQGQAPTSEWEPGESVLDPRVIEVPANLAEGEYTLQALVYDWRNGVRLATPDGKSVITLDTFVVS